jgi:hypothetical protein
MTTIKVRNGGSARTRTAPSEPGLADTPKASAANQPRSSIASSISPRSNANEPPTTTWADSTDRGIAAALLERLRAPQPTAVTDDCSYPTYIRAKGRQDSLGRALRALGERTARTHILRGEDGRWRVYITELRV